MDDFIIINKTTNIFKTCFLKIITLQYIHSLIQKKHFNILLKGKGKGKGKSKGKGKGKDKNIETITNKIKDTGRGENIETITNKIKDIDKEENINKSLNINTHIISNNNDTINTNDTNDTIDNIHNLDIKNNISNTEKNVECLNKLFIKYYNINIKNIYDIWKNNTLNFNKDIDIEKDIKIFDCNTTKYMIPLNKDILPLKKKYINDIKNDFNHNLDSIKIIDAYVNTDNIIKSSNSDESDDLDDIYIDKLNNGIKRVDIGCGICCSGVSNIFSYIKYETGKFWDYMKISCITLFNDKCNKKND